MSSDNETTIFLLASGLLIATYFAVKEKPNEEEGGWPDMPEFPMEGVEGPGKKKKGGVDPTDAVAALIEPP